MGDRAGEKELRKSTKIKNIVRKNWKDQEVWKD